MSVAVKASAFAVLVRMLVVSFGDELSASPTSGWPAALEGLAIASIVVGNIAAVRQTSVKRMLAYSSIAHAGFLLSGVIALNKAGLDASIFDLFAYGVATVGAFAIVSLVTDSSGEVTDLNRWAGLGKRSP